MITAYKKLRLNTYNHYNNGDDFAVGVGTFVFNQKIDKDALKEILTTFTGDISVIQENILGSYCICIHKDDRTYVFVDSNHTYNMYYYKLKERLIVTNTYYHIAKVIEGLEICEMNAIEKTFQYSLLDNGTPFNGVMKLMGEEYLFMDNKKQSSSDNCWTVERIKSTSEKFYKKDLSTVIIDRYQNFDKIFNKSGIFMTGGQDSRLILGLMIKVGLDPILLYGEGNSVNTNTKKEDLEIVKKISSEYKLKLQLMNWRGSGTKSVDKYLEKYGELYSLYNYNENIINEFENNLNIDFVEFGYFGEIFRNVEWLEAYDKTVFTIDDFLDEFYISKGLRYCLQGYENYRLHLYEKLIAICYKKKVDPHYITKDDFQKIHIEYRKSADTEMVNFANLFMYSMPLLSSKIITDQVVNVKFEKKKLSRFQLQVIRNIDKKLLSIPFFSHIKYKAYDSEAGILKDEQPIVMQYKETVRKAIKNERLVYWLKKLYYIIKRDAKGYSEITQDTRAKKEVKKERFELYFFDIEIDKLIKHHNMAQITCINLREQLIRKVVNERRKNS